MNAADAVCVGGVGCVSVGWVRMGCGAPAGGARHVGCLVAIEAARVAPGINPIRLKKSAVGPLINMSWLQFQRNPEPPFHGLWRYSDVEH